MPSWFVVAAGFALGVLSRIEETAAGFSLGISSDGTWLAVAFLAGAAVSRGGALAGAAALTAANLGYYAWISVAEPGVALSAVAGPPERWFLYGAAGGAVFGLAGRLWRAGPPALRLAAALLLGGVLIADGAGALRGDAPADGAGLAAGIALPLLSARGAALRVVAGACVAIVVAVASTGALERFLP